MACVYGDVSATTSRLRRRSSTGDRSPLRYRSRCRATTGAHSSARSCRSPPDRGALDCPGAHDGGQSRDEKDAFHDVGPSMQRLGCRSKQALPFESTLCLSAVACGRFAKKEHSPSGCGPVGSIATRLGAQKLDVNDTRDYIVDNLLTDVYHGFAANTVWGIGMFRTGLLISGLLGFAVAPAAASVQVRFWNYDAGGTYTPGTVANQGNGILATTPNATFTYTGPIDWQNNAPNGDPNLVSSFLNLSDVTNLSGYGGNITTFGNVSLSTIGDNCATCTSFFQITGTGNFSGGTIQHDDGASLYLGALPGPLTTVFELWRRDERNTVRIHSRGRNSPVRSRLC